MKKTIIALAALAGVAMADTTIIGAGLTWDTSSPYKDCTTVTNGNLAYSGGGWWVSGPTGTLTAPITLTQDQVLEFSYSCSFNETNSVLTLALANGNGAVVMGKTYADDVRLGTTTETGSAVSRGYVFGGTNNSTEVANIDDYTTIGKSFTINETNNVSFTVAYDSATSQYVGTLAYDGTTKSVNLGDSFSVNAITATFDGGSSYQGYVNDIKLTVSTVPAPAVPEPTTATLSLLALAGLAARRRRR